jgi:hypothetical protein
LRKEAPVFQRQALNCYYQKKKENANVLTALTTSLLLNRLWDSVNKEVKAIFGDVLERELCGVHQEFPSKIRVLLMDATHCVDAEPIRVQTVPLRCSGILRNFKFFFLERGGRDF